MYRMIHSKLFDSRLCSDIVFLFFFDSTRRFSLISVKILNFAIFFQKVALKRLKILYVTMLVKKRDR